MTRLIGSRNGIAAWCVGGLHILVVEDNEDAREIFRAVLEYFGALVTTSESGRAALNVLRRIGVGLVLTDMQLGDHNAAWLLREARKLGCTAPFILVSGADVNDRRAQAQGFAFCLRKPVEHERLVDTVLAALRDR